MSMVRRNRSSSGFVPIISDTRLPVPRDGRFAEVVADNSPRPIKNRAEGEQSEGQSSDYGSEESRRTGRTEAGKRVVRRCRGIAWYADCEEYPRASFTVGIEVGKSGCSP
jgi:hypothetical protein